MNENLKKILILIGLIIIWIVFITISNNSHKKTSKSTVEESKSDIKKEDRAESTTKGNIEWYYDRQEMKLSENADIFSIREKKEAKPIVTKGAVKIVAKTLSVVTPQVVKEPEPIPVPMPVHIRTDEELILDELSKVIIIGYVKSSKGVKVFFKYDGKNFEANAETVFKVQTERGAFDIKAKITSDNFLQMIEEKNNISVKKRIRGDK